MRIVDQIADGVRTALEAMHHKANVSVICRPGHQDEIMVAVSYLACLKVSELEGLSAEEVVDLLNKAIPIAWVRPPPLIVRELEPEVKV